MAKGKKNKSKQNKKDVIIEQSKAQAAASGKKAKLSAPSKKVSKDVQLTFGKQNYMWMLIGFAMIVVGLLLMTGGAMDDPNVWDESKIYSFRRITLAPIVILIGLGIEIYAIFK